jgi:hypothetical protein
MDLYETIESDPQLRQIEHTLRAINAEHGEIELARSDPAELHPNIIENFQERSEALSDLKNIVRQDPDYYRYITLYKEDARRALG